MIKVTPATIYYLIPICSNYNTPEEYHIHYLNKIVKDAINDKLRYVEKDIILYKNKVYDLLLLVEKETNKQDEFKRYLSIINALASNAQVTKADEMYVNSFEKLIIKPILKNRYDEYITFVDHYKYSKYIIKNSILSTTVVGAFTNAYYCATKTMLQDISKLNGAILTNSKNVKSLFSTNAYLYSEIDKLVDVDNIILLDTPFNILEVISKLDDVVSKETNLHYLTIVNSRDTIFSKDIDIIDLYNRYISDILGIGYDFKSDNFSSLVGKYSKPNVFLKENTILEVLKSWSKK